MSKNLLYVQHDMRIIQANLTIQILSDQFNIAIQIVVWALMKSSLVREYMYGRRPYEAADQRHWKLLTVHKYILNRVNYWEVCFAYVQTLTIYKGNLNLRCRNFIKCSTKCYSYLSHKFEEGIKNSIFIGQQQSPWGKSSLKFLVKDATLTQISWLQGGPTTTYIINVMNI